jgi:redox-sensitive bicupin YhaK (pirin superfamily)
MKNNIPRRSFLGRSIAALGTIFSIPALAQEEEISEPMIKKIRPLGFQWEPADPFLFCVHHEDAFPRGNEQMGPDSGYLKGRQLGDDFIVKDGFRMYHGQTVPGFPGHPHRGFETITVVRKGLVDHADSLGAAGRYGNGDVQWMTAGQGVMHSEMFPLVHAEKDNHMELFQIWLNLPKKNKMVKPHFKMLWREKIPKVELTSAAGRILIEVIAGKFGTYKAPAPPPDSWAADPANEVAVMNIKMDAGTSFTLPAASAGINRTLYFYEGDQLDVAGEKVPNYHAIDLKPDVETILKAQTESSILLLQGKPIGEPVMQYGPFVMNTREEINQAFKDYNSTRFGGWPWPKYDQVHDRKKGRFAKHSDGRIEDAGV